MIGPSDFAVTEDSTLPSGIWMGFFTEPHHPRRGWMHLYLAFENGVIRGEGTDYVGPWTIQGHFEAWETGSANCHWIKQYLGKHQVTYQGTFGDSGIMGQWTIAQWHHGNFHIWPASRADIHRLYADEF